MSTRLTGDEQDLEAAGDLLGFKEKSHRAVSFSSFCAQDCAGQGPGGDEEDEGRGKTIPSWAPSRIQSGKVIIAAGQRATDKELLTMKWFTEGVAGKIPQ